MDIDEVKEFFAETRSAALAMASTHFGVDEGELEVYQLPESVEVSGLEGRSVFLIWHPGAKPAERSADESPRRGGDRGRGRDRDRDRERDGNRDRDRGRRRGGGSEREASDSDRRRRRPRRRRGREEGPEGSKPEGVDDERLEALAKEAAARVRSSGEAEILESMNSKERWVVHNYLREEEGVTSASEGEGPAKRVKILPA